MPAEETHHSLGRVRVVLEHGAEPVKQKGEGYFESCDGILLEQPDERVNESWEPLVSEIGVESREGRDDECYLFIDGVFGE